MPVRSAGSYPLVPASFLLEFVIERLKKILQRLLEFPNPLHSICLVGLTTLCDESGNGGC